MKLYEPTIRVNPTTESVRDDQGCVLSVVAGGTLVQETTRIRRMIREGALVVVVGEPETPVVTETKKPKQEVK